MLTRSSVSARLNAVYLGLLEWQASLVLSKLRDVKVSLKLHRSPDVTVHITVPKHTQTYIHANKKTTHMHRASANSNCSLAGLVVSASAQDLQYQTSPPLAHCLRRNQHMKIACDSVYNKNNKSQ